MQNPLSPTVLTSPSDSVEHVRHYRRLTNHDYAGMGYYMVTFSTEPRRSIFSRIEDYRAILSPSGRALEAAWLKMAEECPQISLREYAVMPDHFHGIVVMRPGSPHPLGWWIRRAKARTTHAVRKLLGDPQFSLFEANFHDWNSLNADMFDAFREYVGANARRNQLRRERRHLLNVVRTAEHPRLNAVPGLHWDCLGDLALLDYPELLPIVVSRRATPEAQAAQLAAWVAKVEHGAIPISGFISPGERAALRTFATIRGVRVIRLLPFGLKDFRPHGRQLENLAESRLLVLSAFPQSVEGCNWDNCHRNNDFARAIAGLIRS